MNSSAIAITHFDKLNLNPSKAIVRFPLGEIVLIFFLIVLNCAFWNCSRIGGWGQKDPIPKICHIFSSVIKLGTVIAYLKKIQKIYESHDKPLEFC